MTHGICGSGGNWRTIARAIVGRRPDWGIRLVDLRQHGHSEPGARPHTIAACADDIRALIDEVGPAAALAGHSFGGKVMLATRALAPPELAQTWSLDASPSPRTADTTNETVIQLLAFVERSPPVWAKRDDFVAALVASHQPRSLAQWFAMNLVPKDGGGYVFRLDTGAIHALLADYAAIDLWPSVLDASLPGSVELVVSSESSTYTDEDRARLAVLPPHVHADIVTAGHWLHIDNPSAVVELFVARLPR